jgi:arylsulfatase
VALNTELRFDFADPVSFVQTRNKSLRLYAAGDRVHPVWVADPEADHPAEGTRTLVFDDLPPLSPDTTYFAISDPGWIRVGDRSAGPINDGAFWYRFRTQGHHHP